ncbi:hypothetical protein DPMN_071956 [Dreissena polymorpha]|uniref:Uncharacterized protein n=1 Tax=Dreissena polymorpha TaxID=45954 RepID=A0A9D3Z7I5_DREPO|nr:hypothetical protein DPMN_071956 [Dreissena polymorpha]
MPKAKAKSKRATDSVMVQKPSQSVCERGIRSLTVGHLVQRQALGHQAQRQSLVQVRVLQSQPVGHLLSLSPMQQLQRCQLALRPSQVMNRFCL